MEKIVIPKGGIKKTGLYIKKIKNPKGVGTSLTPKTAELGEKPPPTSNAGGGQPNPWEKGQITQQMLISEQDPNFPGQKRGISVI
ncbi:MAG: hypothetical protein CM15mV99_330 [Caudoviricetes sp.]|nr:MAG: hypothetical protein CM15mV99_330 [Caudoviricetes sp.]